MGYQIRTRTSCDQHIFERRDTTKSAALPGGIITHNFGITSLLRCRIYTTVLYKSYTLPLKFLVYSSTQIVANVTNTPSIRCIKCTIDSVPVFVYKNFLIYCQQRSKFYSGMFSVQQETNFLLFHLEVDKLNDMRSSFAEGFPPHYCEIIFYLYGLT